MDSRALFIFSITLVLYTGCDEPSTASVDSSRGDISAIVAAEDVLQQDIGLDIARDLTVSDSPDDVKGEGGIQPGSTIWAIRAGGGAAETVTACAVDATGNFYLTGQFQGKSQFGSTKLVSAGNDDIYLSKVDPKGKFIWTIRAGGTETDLGPDLSLDGSGNVYLTNGVKGPADFGSLTVKASQSPRLYVARATPAGKFDWLYGAQGTGLSRGRGIALDTAGNIHLTGRFEGEMVLGTSKHKAAGNSDILMAKLGKKGDVIWVRPVGGPGWEGGSDLGIDPKGNVLVSGQYQSTSVTFGGTTLKPHGKASLFLTRLDSKGKYLWAIGIGGAKLYEYAIARYPMHMAIDSAGNSILTGYFTGTVQFGKFTISSPGTPDVFVSKVGPAGKVSWVTTAGGNGYDIGTAVALAGGGYYVVGKFQLNAKFGAKTLTSKGINDVYLGRLDSLGNITWIEWAGGPADDVGLCIASDGKKHIYVAGYFQDRLNFGGKQLVSSGSYDIFVWKLASPTP